MSRRVKINFDIVNDGNITVLDKEAVAKARYEIGKSMETHVREHRRKQVASELHAKKMIINS